MHRIPASAIVHLTTTADWWAARDAAHFSAPSLETEGFIHCSTTAQALATAARYYADQLELLALIIDASQLDVPLRYEISTGGEAFPHVYGPIPTSAVLRVIPLRWKGDRFEAATPQSDDRLFFPQP